MFTTMEQCTDFIFKLKAVDHKRAPLVMMREVLAHLDNPQDKIKAIHIAGSNGKGSTVNALRKMFEGAGYKVGAFTSPHLERVNERMTINGVQIPDAQFLQYMNAVARIIETHYNGDYPSFFEVITLIMFLYLAAAQVDFALIETGLGGRLDATNVITPLVSIITTISLEHTAFLGDTYAKVAFEKAGIIKEGVPVIVGVKNEEALAIIREVASERHAECFILGEDFTSTTPQQLEGMQQFDYEKADIKMQEIALKMAGAHQVANASLAVTAMLVLQEKGHVRIAESSIRTALQTAQWAGRFEQVAQNIVLDGAHNSEGTAALIQTLKDVYPNRKYNFIYAALSDKDHVNSVALMDKVANSIAFTQISLPNAMPAEQLAALSQHPKKVYSSDWLGVIDAEIQGKEVDDILVITGSLYFIAEARKSLLEVVR
ncbi:bifunctional folylpolyglutamate synthase/dihydrofolate synthase [Lysinibacillus sp. NPDC097287]|uniref:bifunctional folylpolyglutamate synthase/dihydrofolate synthase n=1 Tax=Lysinibacillus sp. NPDC097287 TaxID=3364144 RepID=UPI00381B1E70